MIRNRVSHCTSEDSIKKTNQCEYLCVSFFKFRSQSETSMTYLMFVVFISVFHKCIEQLYWSVNCNARFDWLQDDVWFSKKV